MVTGLSWKFLCMIANRGDLKQRRVNQVTANANLARDKAGITLEELTEQDHDSRY